MDIVVLEEAFDVGCYGDSMVWEDVFIYLLTIYLSCRYSNYSAENVNSLVLNICVDFAIGNLMWQKNTVVSFI